MRIRFLILPTELSYRFAFYTVMLHIRTYVTSPGLVVRLLKYYITLA
jgi:hypothetical protein